MRPKRSGWIVGSIVTIVLTALVIGTAGCGGGEAADARPDRAPSPEPAIVAVDTTASVEREVATVPAVKLVGSPAPAIAPS